jgi:hypothetical protein
MGSASADSALVRTSADFSITAGTDLSVLRRAGTIVVPAVELAVARSCVVPAWREGGQAGWPPAPQ